MFVNNRFASQRHPENGPFSVVPNTGGPLKHGKPRKPFKVVNTHGYRVHWGTQGSCNAVCDKLNTDVARHIMLKPERPVIEFGNIDWPAVEQRVRARLYPP